MPTEIQITVDSYRLWLRAQRPPFEWFAALTAAEQKALAEAGEDERARANLELAYMTRDPEAAEAILTGDEVAATFNRVVTDRTPRDSWSCLLDQTPDEIESTRYFLQQRAAGLAPIVTDFPKDAA